MASKIHIYIIYLLKITWFKQRSAEEARGAHNPEVGGSKPPAANVFFFFFLVLGLFPFTIRKFWPNLELARITMIVNPKSGQNYHHFYNLIL